ncbi:MAG: serine/threonine-protein kinase [Myxococcota bacterium]
MRRAPKPTQFSPTRDVVAGANGYVGRIFGDFRIRKVERATEQLAVYLADDLTPQPRRYVLLKVLRRPGLDDPDFERSFDAEAQVALRLHHPAILRAFARPEIDGFPAIAFEGTDGPRLSQVLQQARGRGVGLPFDAVCTIGVRLLEGLQYAHRQTDLDRQPLAHQSVCPDNVYLRRSGSVRLAHFAGRGLDRLSDLQVRLPYLAPEQVNGAGQAASDQYGVAVILVELISGRRLFEAASPRALAQAIVDRDRPPVARLLPFKSTALEIALERALSVDPRDRFPNAAAFAKALDRALAQGGRSIQDEAVAEALESANAVRTPSPVQDQLQRHRIGAQPLVFSEGRKITRSQPRLPAPQPEQDPVMSSHVPEPRSTGALKMGLFAATLAGLAAAGWFAGQSLGW